MTPVGEVTIAFRVFDVDGAYRQIGDLIFYCSFLCSLWSQTAPATDRWLFLPPQTSTSKPTSNLWEGSRPLRCFPVVCDRFIVLHRSVPWVVRVANTLWISGEPKRQQNTSVALCRPFFCPLSLSRIQFFSIVFPASICSLLSTGLMFRSY